MGFQTVVNVLNDAIHHIEDNPKQFVDNLVDAILARKGYIAAGSYCNAAKVLGQDHADAFQLYLVHGNTGERIVLDLTKGTATFTMYGKEYIIKPNRKKKKS